MALERSIRRYRIWYARLLRLYSRPFYERFGESMEQTFTDLLRDRAEEAGGLFGCAVYLFLETGVALIREKKMSKNLVRVALVTALLLMVPLLAMQFTTEVAWGPADFVIAGGLIFGAGLVFELVVRLGSGGAYRGAVGIAVATGLLLVWMNLAVGIIGNEENPANLMFGGVLAVAGVGSAAARFRPLGMARVMYATAGAQLLVGAVALAAGLGFTLHINGLFAALWIASGVLFARAGRADPDLASVVAAWGTLPDGDRERILGIVKPD